MLVLEEEKEPLGVPEELAVTEGVQDSLDDLEELGVVEGLVVGERDSLELTLELTLEEPEWEALFEEDGVALYVGEREDDPEAVTVALKMVASQGPTNWPRREMLPVSRWLSPP